MGTYGHRDERDCSDDLQWVQSPSSSSPTILSLGRSNDFYEIMDMLDKRMNDKGKNWRHVLKSLKVLDYCLHEGSELVVTWARKNVYIIKTLREFQYVDDDGKDVGQNGERRYPLRLYPELMKISTDLCKRTYIVSLGRGAPTDRAI